MPKPTHEPKGSQIAKPNPLEGIEFADEPKQDPRTLDAPPRAQTVETMRANQEAARQAIDRLHHERASPMYQEEAPEPPKLVEPTKAELKELESRTRIFRVIGAHKITRGASSYTLAAGKLVTNKDYDIDGLRAQGVQLEEYRPPA